MNFQEAAARFERSESGTDAFKLLYKDAFELMRSDMANAGLYFVIGSAAQSYVRRYEDQGVSGEFADYAKSVLHKFNTRIVEALAAEPATRLAILGEVAAEYQLHVSEF
ncbi:hypothetical protein SAMN05216344_11114 [Polaromonas sp. OV174]|uniref:hypothetical protein n=1 Tax=Polaromonas sp. OV174 TaxID=1855300 RepID=UPI0008EE3698|nr:hypothetical protein [Polaromonas sp. OV174]SFC19651.1 hypothetical protein SAMN05216344_11114 [Polaromonas sp. OV174]